MVSLSELEDAMSDGVIKFRCEWTHSPLEVDLAELEPLHRWRTRLREVGLIGVLPDGVGFGNISVRAADRTFLITGSGTGGLTTLDPSHYSLVTGYDFEANLLHCQGQTAASSESLSHAAIYDSRPAVGAVIHIHSQALWETYIHRLPTTEVAFEYGTPQMAMALADLSRGLDNGQAHTVVMGGHRDGLVTFGPNLEKAGEEILRLVALSQD